MAKVLEENTADEVPPLECGHGQISLLMEAITEAVTIRTQTEFVYLNAAARKLFGMADDFRDYASIDHTDIVHPDDYAMQVHYFQRRLAEKEAPSHYEFRVSGGQDPFFWVSCVASTIVWEGKPAVLACITDISSQKKAQQENNRFDRLFRHIFDLVPDVMLLVSLTEGRIVDVNPEFVNVFGKRREDVIGKISADIGIWADGTFLDRFVEELKMTTSMMDVPTTVRTRGNVIRHFQLFAQKIEYGLQPLLLLVGRDVTEDLLQEQELRRRKDDAELANRSKSAFLANMSHELRTPLNGILGFAEIIRDEMIGPIGNARYSEYAQDVHESGTHLLAIINDILDLSKVEAGHMQTHVTWIDPIDCLDTCLSLVRGNATDNGISMIRDLDETIFLEADERLLKQIVINLLSNSVKYTESGGTVTLSFKRTGNAGVCLSVTDTGIGMTPDEVKIARRPFGQVVSRLSKKLEGSGLGLPLVCAFTEKMGGTMTIESQTEVGTRVNIIFPPLKVKEKESDTPEGSDAI
ncbi:MAG: PAS domain-containing sensor histidine kinase [Kordiimonadaceae bacterium]|nr:PAS domain-containing sensor histidine kinase [Kordiimonadaceae bacterium]